MDAYGFITFNPSEMQPVILEKHLILQPVVPYKVEGGSSHSKKTKKHGGSELSRHVSGPFFSKN